MNPAETPLTFSIVTRNHFHLAAALEENFRQYHPAAPFVIVVADGDSPCSWSSQEWAQRQAVDKDWSWELLQYFPALAERVDPLKREHKIQGTRILRGSDVCPFPFLNFAFQYSPLELTCALKSQAARKFFHQGYRRLLYLDADVRLFCPAEELMREIDEGGLLLTPHFHSPLPSDRFFPNNIDILRCGVFNAGIFAIQGESTGQARRSGRPNEPKTNENGVQVGPAAGSGHAANNTAGTESDLNLQIASFLNWWADTCAQQCLLDPHDGVFVDQKWLDQAMAMCTAVKVSRDSGINVGYWNLHERRLGLSADNAIDLQTVHGRQALKAFHFSGFNPTQPKQLSVHQNRFALKADPLLQRLCNEFADSLQQAAFNSLQTIRCLPYAYDHLNDQTPIDPKWREVIRLNLLRWKETIDNPFQFFANDVGKARLEKASTDIAQGRFQFRLDAMHQRIADLRNRLDRGPLRRLLKMLKKKIRRVA